jgi:hypothetical protein
MRRTLALILLTLAPLGWGEDRVSTAAAGDSTSIAVSGLPQGTWFAFVDALDFRTIYYCEPRGLSEDGELAPKCTKVVSDRYDEQMKKFGKGSQDD